MSTVLIVEDEERIASFVEKGLRAAGLQTVVARDGATGLAIAQAEACDLVVLDIGLPGIDGWEVLERLRGSGNTLPVIMLTARDSVHDTVTGLENGANDYVTKPFQFAELLARVRLRLREDQGPIGPDINRMVVGAVTLDLRTRRVEVDGAPVSLTAREFTLLHVLMEHPGHVLSREQLLGQVWDTDFDPRSNVVDVFVRTLRRKIGADRIETVRGMGYRFATE